MRIARRRARRRGFTLLEVLLASAIGIMLLGGLYMAFDMTLRQTDAGREIVERGDLARAVVNRMTIDVTGCLGPLQPKAGGGLPADATGTAASSTTTSAAATTTTTTTTATASTGTATASADAAAAIAPAEATGAMAADVPFQGGVFGTDKQLTLYVSRVPPALTSLEAANQGTTDPRPDQRRVTYYLGSGGGLCRQEKPWVTAEGVRNSTDPDYSDEASDLLSDEVTDVQFEYYAGGSTWASSWTGSDPTADGKTPMGPPRAIRVTLTIQPGGPGSSAHPKQVVHVFSLRAAVGLYQPVEQETTDAAATTTGGM